MTVAASWRAGRRAFPASTTSTAATSVSRRSSRDSEPRSAASEPSANVMRPVVVGAARDGQTVVQSGIKPGETVVIDGQLRLVPGARVDGKLADSLKAMASEADP